MIRIYQDLDFVVKECSRCKQEGTNDRPFIVEEERKKSMQEKRTDCWGCDVA